MHKAFVIVPLMGWAGVAALVHYTRFPLAPKHSYQDLVVVVPARQETGRRTPVSQASHRALPRPGDRVALVRELQKELTRVGCYDGAISGVWTTASRRAMRTFTQRVNARLPTSKPDVVLLSLVQGHRKRACGIDCPAGQQEDDAGRCVPDAIARATKQPPDAPTDPPARTPQIMIGSTAAAAAVAARMREPQGNDASPPAAKRAEVPPKPSDAEKPRPPAAKSTAARRAGVHKRKHRRAARRAKKPSPPAVVQSLIRNVKSALGIY